MGVGVRLNVERHKEQLAKHGRVELVGEYNGVDRKNLYRCLEHGEVHEAFGTNVVSGRGLHCCRVAAGRKGKHGMTSTPTWRSWEGMRARCNRVTDPEYANYGGRGVRVCQRWADSFESFLQDMGERPPGMTLDRINSEGDYEPSNCRWATITEQNNNKRNNIKLAYQGKVRPLAEVARLCGVNPGTIKCRLYSGWSAERAVLKIDGRKGK